MAQGPDADKIKSFPTIHKIWANGELIETTEDQTVTDPVLLRMMSWQVEEELNMLVDDINAGLFGEAAKTGKFMAYVKSIKDRYPKP